MKLFQKLFLLTAMLVVSSSIMAQTNKSDNRYLKFENDNEIFIIKGQTVEIRDMVLCNIMENESSKPIHLAVNDLNNVVKFSIKSHSEKHATQRSCYIILDKNNYKDTFRLVLNKLNVNMISYNDELISPDDFYIQIQK